MTVRLKTIATIVLATFATTSAFADESPGAAPTAASLLNQVGISPRFGVQTPLDAEFRDSDGQAVRLGECLGKQPVILHLVYFQCPMLCRLSRDGLLKTLSTLSLRLGQDYRVVTISFDPREGPPLAASAKQLALERIDPGAPADAWHFLTGNEPAIRRVCDAVGFRYAYDEARGQFAHASGVFVLTPEGKLSRFLGGVDFSPRDLRLALVDASAGTIGTKTDQILLMCYQYDPSKGKYGLAIMTGLRLAAGATVASLAAYIVIMLRRERRQTATPAVTQINSTSAP